jgi:hypothetical protein
MKGQEAMRNSSRTLIAALLGLLACGLAPAVAADEADLEQLKPADLTDDLTVWPNKISYRNSDPWLWQNHDKIRKMRPRVLVINFANTHDMEAIRKAAEQYSRAISESTRYHGFDDPDAPAFIEYQIVKYVDMRDRPVPEERAKRNSAFFPYKPKGTPGQNCDYSRFYSDEFARAYGFQYPGDHTRYLNLHELINAGLVHELWFFAIHDDRGSPLETIEIKQYYDDDCRPIEGKHGPAGNGHDDSIPWSGRSFRITFLNVHRGIGCGMENLGHALEGTAHANAIPYFRKYFYEFGEFDLDERYGLPWKSLYPPLWGEGNRAEYPDKTTMVIHSKGKTYQVENYVAFGGNVHFPPGARGHYDLDSPYVVKTVIENYRLRNGPDGKDKVHDFDKGRFKQYADLAPDCMGQWMIYWRQCMPGLDNKCVDDEGQPMKNWWVFLFY